jgi:predicted dehydrogenase
MAAGGAVAAQAAPSDQIRLGVIGSGGRGRYVMGVFKRDPRLKVAAICDVYEPNLEAGLSAAGGGAKVYRNYKALLDDKEIDALLIATPEHWHYQMLMDTMAAGKDAYSEKPLCQTPEQGVALVDAAKKSTSIIQIGMQRRSFDVFLKARDIKHAGTLGNIRMVRTWWLNNDLNVKPRPLKGPLDWNQWQGPARKHEPDPYRFYNWGAFRDYSGGRMVDQGVHIFDGIHIVMGSGAPRAVTSAAGKIHKPGVDTSESVVVVAEYPEDYVAVFTINYAAMTYKWHFDQLNQFDGDKARMDVGREHFVVYNAGAEERPVNSMNGDFNKAVEMHVDNFLECVRTRKQPNAPVEIGFHAALVVQMANISLDRGRRVEWDAGARRVKA